MGRVCFIKVLPLIYPLIDTPLTASYAERWVLAKDILTYGQQEDHQPCDQWTTYSTA